MDDLVDTRTLWQDRGDGLRVRSLSVKLEDVLYEAVRVAARRDGRTVASWVRRVLLRQIGMEMDGQ